MDTKKQVQEKSMATSKVLKRSRRVMNIFLITISIFIFSYFSSPCIIRLLCSIHEFITRKAMFLFCNVILLFLAKDSCKFSSPVYSKVDIYEDFLIKREDLLKSSICSSEVQEEEEEEEEEYEDAMENEEQEGMGDVVAFLNHENDIREAEEFNRRCDEFIEKTKRDRRLEALQLVLS